MKTCISLFAGGGGLDLGLEAAGFSTLVASDIDEHSCLSLEQNKRHSAERQSHFLKNADIVCRDIRSIEGKTFLNLSGLAKGELDLLAGGPPCQAFSIFGKRRGLSDERGQLVYHYLRMISDIQPKSFIFENVFGILSVEKGNLLREIVSALENPSPTVKYTVSVIRINAADVGTPQFRDRVFIVGTRNGNRVSSPLKLFCDPRKNFETKQLRWRTVADALKGVPDQTKIGWYNHTGRNHSDRIIQRYDKMSPGERDHFTRINRLDLGRPSYAIIVGSDKGGGKGHVHPRLPREVTPRESARMQCFPDWWWFSGTSRHPIRQIGNAVPTILAYSIGYVLLKDAFKVAPKSFGSAIRALDQKHLFSESDIKFVEASHRENQQMYLSGAQVI